MYKTLSFPLITGITLFALVLFSFYPSFVGAAESPLVGKIVALDSGHGESESSFGTSGVCVTDTSSIVVKEVEVNNAVRQVLADMVTQTGGEAFLVPQLESRNARVDAAEASNSNVLISIHHNGSTNTSADYTQFFVTQKNDKELANAIYPFMLSAVGGVGKGIKSDGYGMTVYGSLPGVLTESYFITNTDRACKFVNYLNNPTDTNSIVHREAHALFAGLESYFATQTSGGSGGGKGGNR